MCKNVNTGNPRIVRILGQTGTALNGDLCFDQICSILVQKLAIFLEKTHFIREFGQFSTVLKPHYSKPHYTGTPCHSFLVYDMKQLHHQLEQIFKTSDDNDQLGLLRGRALQACGKKESKDLKFIIFCKVERFS